MSELQMDSGSDRTDDRVIETMNLIDKKWHPVIIQHLLAAGPLRFNELQARLEGVSGKVLTDSLEDLAENDLVERNVVSESPKRVEYELTSHGRDLQSVIESLAEWGERNLGESTRPTVLVVDDDPRLVSMHAGWLEDTYDVERAHNGKQAIRTLSSDVDLVLLDRMMPGLSGDELLEKIRDANVDCRVVMLTAVEPEFDVADMQFDAYLVKPGGKSELRTVVETVLERSSYDEPMLEYLSLQARQTLLAARTTAGDRAESEEYAHLVKRLETLEAEIEEPSKQAAKSVTIAELIDE